MKIRLVPIWVFLTIASALAQAPKVTTTAADESLPDSGATRIPAPDIPARPGGLENLTIIPATKPPQSLIQVVPNHENWTYGLGEPASFRITVAVTPYPAEGVTVNYKLGPEKFEGAEKSIIIPAEGITLDGGTRTEPGFTRCIVTATLDGKKQRATAAAGYAPEKLLATAIEPPDFDAFWETQKATLTKIPLEPEITPAPHLSTPSVEVSYVSFRNVSGRFYGLLSVPRGDGPFPAALAIPGGGVWRRGGDSGASNDIGPDLAQARRGVIVLQVGVHGIPLNLDPKVYTALQSGPLSGYFGINSHDRERHYFRRVILGCLRSNDFLAAHPKWDGKNLIAKGGSQGGMLAIVTGALDSRVTAVVPCFPSSSGIPPQPGSPEEKVAQAQRAGIAAAAAVDPSAPQHPAGDYYSTINFARRLKIPGFYLWGYNDEGCYPTINSGIYNLITAPKQLLVALEQGHGSDPEQKIRADEWIAATGQRP